MLKKIQEEKKKEKILQGSGGLKRQKPTERVHDSGGETWWLSGKRVTLIEGNSFKSDISHWDLEGLTIVADWIFT